jgi:hypothetical protein
MSENRDTGVDPRFDPVFQRGYDPKVHGGRRVRTTARHATGPTPIVSTRQPLAPVADAAAEPAPAGEPIPEVGPTADVPPPAEPRGEPAIDLSLQTRNPFRLALLVVSIVSIAVAALLIWNRVGEDMYYGGFSGTNQGLLFRSQLFASLPVPMLTGGLLGLTLWVALGAMAHRSRGEADDE